MILLLFLLLLEQFGECQKTVKSYRIKLFQITKEQNLLMND